MEWIWVVTTVILLFLVYRISFIKGYRAGATKVLNEWKRNVNYEEEHLDE